ncbi:DUF960 family protein [Enterococcus faecalis]
MKPFYITPGIQNDIPQEVLEFILVLYHKRLFTAENVDYLQVFELTGSKYLPRLQLIQHRQEEPELIENSFVPLTESDVCETTIYIIDDGEYRTMLLADEY